jgi:hypothetical protein
MPVIGARPTPQAAGIQTPILNAAFRVAELGDQAVRYALGSTVGRLPGAKALGLPGMLFGGPAHISGLQPYTWGLDGTLRLSVFALEQIAKGLPEAREGDPDTLGAVATDLKSGLSRAGSRFAANAKSKLGLG